MITMDQNKWFRMETIIRASTLVTHFRCCELGHIRASLLGKKDCVGVGITFYIDSPAR